MPKTRRTRQAFAQHARLVFLDADTTVLSFAASNGLKNRRLPPPAYVLLNAALRPIIAEDMAILQRGTLDSTAPLLNATVSTIL